MKKKLISIIINCYNGEKYLQKTLDSILIQKYRRYEVIFVDNCSIDRSAKIFKKINDKRFRYFKTKKKIKLYESRNFAIKKCKGDYITFIDTDDWWDKNFLISRKKFFDSSDEYGFCYSNCFHYYENKNSFVPFSQNHLPSGFILDNLLKYYFIKMGTRLLKKKIFDFFKFNPTFNIIGDFDLVIRAAQKFKGMAFQDLLVNIRIHKDNFTHNNRGMFYREYKVWLKNQNFGNKYFRKNKSQLFERLEYLRLVNLLINKKSFNLVFDILKLSFSTQKLKLLLIYFLPNFFIKFKLKYF